MDSNPMALSTIYHHIKRKTASQVKIVKLSKCNMNVILQKKNVNLQKKQTLLQDTAHKRQEKNTIM